jgi:addiction module RelE/StbE family toxin
MIVTTTRKFDKRFKKQSARIKQEFGERIKIFLEDINNPILNIHKLSGKLNNLWSFNLSGDVRVIFDKSQKGVIILVDIGSHSELYS